MTNFLRLLPTATTLALLAAGCGPGLESSGEDELSASSHEIVGGTTDTGHDAVALLYADPGYICTGTVIDKRVFLTAAHCISDNSNPSAYIVLGGTDLNNNEPDYQINVSAVNVHPQYDPANSLNDVGIVELSSNAPVEPYRWLTTGADANEIYEVGQEFTAVGYGDTGGSGDTSGTKRKVDLDIVEIYQDVTIYGNGTQNTCFGDSGGPDLVTIDGYPTVIGVHSFVTGGDCFEYGGSMRTDDNRAFISGYASANAGTAKIGGGGGGGSGSKNPLACSIASVTSTSPLAAALMAFVAIVTVARRRRLSP